MVSYNTLFSTIVLLFLLVYFTLLILRNVSQEIPLDEYEDYYRKSISELKNDSLDVNTKEIIKDFRFAIIDSSINIEKQYSVSVISELQDMIGFTLDTSLLIDFYNKNTKKYKFAYFFDLCFPCTLLTQGTIDTINDYRYWKDKQKYKFGYSLRNPDIIYGYDLFKKQYKGCYNYRSFSRVGFDIKKETAIFWHGISGWGMHNNVYLIVMKKKKGKWIEMGKIENRIY